MKNGSSPARSSVASTPESRSAVALRFVKWKAYQSLDWPMRRLPIHTIRTRLWLVPPLLRWRRRRFLPPLRAWPAGDFAVPPGLRTVPGIRRRPEEEDLAEREAPIGSWLIRHANTLETIFKFGWSYQLPMAPWRFRLARTEERLARVPPSPRPAEPDDPDDLTRDLKSLAAQLGINGCGVAEYDVNYAFVENRSKKIGDRVIVCVLESNWKATQTAPSSLSEKAQLAANVELSRRMLKLEQFLKSRGYNARQSNRDHVILHYAVETGLGQLGVNGQVLTPYSGSRCRFATIDTDAPLVIDHPVDYGVHKICDACQVCVRRCPSGAIPATRAYHRGIEKIKINSSRCSPVVAKVHHCSVCMKVCPVQRYGLKPVIDEYEKTGRILGKDTNELESFEFEGKLFQVGERPKLRPEWFADVPFDDESRAARRAARELKSVRHLDE